MIWIYIIVVAIILLLLFSFYLIIQIIECNKAIEASKERLTTYNEKTISLSYGNMSYVDKGEGEVILSVHGIFGGYDQAYDNCKNFKSDYRIIAPSRFGYLGSDKLNNGTPSDQAKAFVELLDKLEIDKVYLLSVSAGGSVAIKFALDYPERTKGIILYCSAMPYVEKPKKYMKYAGPPPFLCNSYAMFLISPLFKLIMGMKPSIIYDILPCNNRKDGVILDASVTNIDMAKNFDNYPIEKMQVPSLVIQAKDDKLSNYTLTEKAVKRFPKCTFLLFESGGHLLEGHENEIKEAVFNFTKKF